MVLVAGHCAFHEGPVLRSVVGLGEVGEFVDDDVVDETGWELQGAKPC